MGEPLLFGAVQVIITFVLLITEVLGIAGVLGFAAALMVTTEELELNPTIFLAITRNE